MGFQTRNDTYTKKLAYVIYYDEKGKLRKEPSWNSWRDKKIDPEEFDNVPTEGFVLNKKVGGYAGDWGNFRQAYGVKDAKERFKHIYGNYMKIHSVQKCDEETKYNVLNEYWKHPVGIL